MGLSGALLAGAHVSLPLVRAKPREVQRKLPLLGLPRHGSPDSQPYLRWQSCLARWHREAHAAQAVRASGAAVPGPPLRSRAPSGILAPPFRAPFADGPRHPNCLLHLGALRRQEGGDRRRLSGRSPRPSLLRRLCAARGTLPAVQVRGRPVLEASHHAHTDRHRGRRDLRRDTRRVPEGRRTRVLAQTRIVAAACRVCAVGVWSTYHSRWAIERQAPQSQVLGVLCLTSLTRLCATIAPNQFPKFCQPSQEAE